MRSLLAAALVIACLGAPAAAEPPALTARFPLPALLAGGRFDGPLRALVDETAGRLSELAGTPIAPLSVTYLLWDDGSCGGRMPCAPQNPASAVADGSSVTNWHVNSDTAGANGRSSRIAQAADGSRPLRAFLVHGSLAVKGSPASDGRPTAEWELSRLSAKRHLLARPADRARLLDPQSALGAIDPPGRAFGLDCARPALLARFHALEPFARFLERAKAIALTVDGRKVEIRFTPVAGARDELFADLKAYVKAGYEGIDDVNRASGYNFWVRNWTMFIRSASVRKREGSIVVAGQLIDRGEEFVLRVVLPEVARFLDEFGTDAATRRREAEARATVAARALGILKSNGAL